MEDFVGILVPVAFVAFMLAIGYFAGGWAERAHLQRLDERERANSDFFVTQIKSCPGAARSGPAPTMFIGEVVIASDYLKSFLGSLRNIFGGEVRSYQTLLDRARREALLRIIDQARAGGYNAVCNVRFDPADVGGNTTTAKKGVVMAAILASATAYRRAG
jgi:uncharacterized protein YbjQ (UPF0145 family)